MNIIPESDKKYGNRDKNDRFLETINQHLTDARIVTIGDKYIVLIILKEVEILEMHSIRASECHQLAWVRIAREARKTSRCDK